MWTTQKRLSCDYRRTAVKINRSFVEIIRIISPIQHENELRPHVLVTNSVPSNHSEIIIAIHGFHDKVNNLKCVCRVRLAGELLASFVMIEMVAFCVLESKPHHPEHQTI